MNGGNSFFLGTERHNKELEAEGFRSIGAGVSDAGEGALRGPAIMPMGEGDLRSSVQFLYPYLRMMRGERISLFVASPFLSGKAEVTIPTQL